MKRFSMWILLQRYVILILDLDWKQRCIIITCSQIHRSLVGKRGPSRHVKLWSGKVWIGVS